MGRVGGRRAAHLLHHLLLLDEHLLDLLHLLVQLVEVDLAEVLMFDDQGAFQITRILSPKKTLRYNSW